MKTTDEIAGHYAELFAAYGPDHRAGDNGSRESQALRHSVLSQGIDGTPWQSTVLDVGCGIGDFVIWNICGPGSEGWDISRAHIDAANARQTTYRFLVRDLTESPETNAFDYVVASGLFQFRDGGYLRHAVKRMYALARKGVAFNFLTKTDGTEGETWHGAIGVIGWAAMFCPHVTLRRDYLPNDATVYLRK